MLRGPKSGYNAWAWRRVSSDQNRIGDVDTRASFPRRRDFLGFGAFDT
jgi:hypothetical protein